MSSYTKYNDANIDHQTANLKETPVSESTGALAQWQGPPADRCLELTDLHPLELTDIQTQRCNQMKIWSHSGPVHGLHDFPFCGYTTAPLNSPLV